jgi:hypothetical protein
MAVQGHRHVGRLVLALSATASLFLSIHTAASASTTVGYWRFEESSAGQQASGAGSILDTSGAGDNGTPGGGPTYRADAAANPVPQTGASNQLSLEFEGTDDNITFSSAFEFNHPTDATLEFWLKPSSSDTGEEDIFWTRTDNTDANRFNIALNNSTHDFGLDYRDAAGNLHSILTSPSAIPSDTWTFIALTRSGNTYSLYEGCNATPVVQGVDANPNLPTNTGWTMSGRTNPANLLYNGRIDEVRLSSAALTPSQFLACAPPVQTPEWPLPALVVVGGGLLAAIGVRGLGKAERRRVSVRH